MMSTLSTLFILLMLGLVGLMPSVVHALDESTIARLHTAKEIYLSTQRKSGEWGSAAPVWFWYTDEVIYLTASPSSYKAKRILDGRNTVRIAVGSQRRSDVYRHRRDCYGRGYRRTHGRSL